jgi:hypothetical protein
VFLHCPIFFIGVDESFQYGRYHLRHIYHWFV